MVASLAKDAVYLDTTVAMVLLGLVNQTSRVPKAMQKLSYVAFPSSFFLNFTDLLTPIRRASIL